MASPGIFSWEAVLDELERNVVAARAAMEDGPDASAVVPLTMTLPPHAPEARGHRGPSAGLGPLPAHLASRAADLLAAIKDAATRTAVLRDDLGRQLAAVRSVPLAEDAGSSVYLDVSG